jgi:hypothetical protein
MQSTVGTADSVKLNIPAAAARRHFDYSTTLELSNEDLLRLNVLLANPIDAIRIDESSMTVCGLTGATEARVRLHPTGRAEQYLRRVRELLSGHVLGSPGGYPAYLQRWTRMGQARDARLAELLMLGDPEAVVAVAGAPGLTDELARRAWWALPTADNARCMLERECVVRGAMGKVLAAYLVEYLPFETEPAAMISSVRLVLQPGLIDSDTRRALWNKGKSKSALHIGFLATVPHDLPEQATARADYHEYQTPLALLADAGNSCAAALLQLLDSPGQTFLQVADKALRRPSNQDAAVALLNAIGAYFRRAWQLDAALQDVDAIQVGAACLWQRAISGDSGHADLDRLAQAVPPLQAEIVAALALAQVDETLLNPIFARTTAVGTVMTKKMLPVVAPVAGWMRELLE